MGIMGGMLFKLKIHVGMICQELVIISHDIDRIY